MNATSENAQHLLALDPFTQAVLKSRVDMLDQERRDFGPDYQAGQARRALGVVQRGRLSVSGPETRWSR